jgi:hypothetical protein
MFLVGLEVNPGILRGSAKSAILASQASLVAPFVCGVILAEALYWRLGAGAPRLPFVLFFGAAMGITAFPVLARILAERKLWNTRVGMIALSCAAVSTVRHAARETTARLQTPIPHSEIRTPRPNAKSNSKFGTPKRPNPRPSAKSHHSYRPNS